MPAATHRARYSVLTVSLSAWEGAAGVLLEDPATDRLYVRMRHDWEQIANDEAEVLSALEDDLAAKAIEMGAAALFSHLEDTLSNTVTVTDRRETIVENFDRAIGRLYREHVRSTVREYVTHLPRYSLAVAAGPFLENREVEAEGWEEAPAGLRLTKDQFVARIAGESMEPLIPDGALCVFRRFGAGSRQGRLVLVEALGRGDNDRYTVKRYHSEKIQTGGEADPEWKHGGIRLEPLNPAFEAWYLDPDEERYRILAEFVRLLD
jgi:phage repressor protein C with HTH and peptisase S24 domain